MPPSFLTFPIAITANILFTSMAAIDTMHPFSSFHWHCCCCHYHCCWLCCCLCWCHCYCVLAVLIAATIVFILFLYLFWLLPLIMLPLISCILFCSFCWHCCCCHYHLPNLCCWQYLCHCYCDSAAWISVAVVFILIVAVENISIAQFIIFIIWRLCDSSVWFQFIKSKCNFVCCCFEE